MMLSWRLWLAVAALAGVALGLYQIRSQAEEIGRLEAESATQAQAVTRLGELLAEQRERHQEELAARDAALASHRQQAQAAQARAAALDRQFTEARSADADVDACMGMRLPDGIADSLRQ